MPGGPPLTFLTVALTPELPFARVLAASVRTHHPDARMLVVCADGPAPEALPAGAEAVGAPDLGLPVPPAEVAFLAPERWSALALVPALRRALDAGGPVVALAPDSTLAGPLDGWLASADPVVLLRRSAGDLPADGLHPDAKDLAYLPAVDPGVLVLRPGPAADEVLERIDAVTDRATPWAALADGGIPGVFEELLDDPAIAQAALDAPPGLLAWWNLTGAALGRDDQGSATIDGEPVTLMRLPEFDPELPTRLHPLLNRVRVSREPVLRELLDDIAARLRAAGADAPRPRPVRLPDGRPLPPAMAALMAEALAGGELAEPPADPAAWEAFHALLNRPAEFGQEQGMTRYLAALWRSREDLRTVYPDVRGADLDGYLGWVWVYGKDLVPDALLPPRPAHVPEDARGGAADLDEPDEHRSDPLWGVNVAGYFRSELGLGEAARLLIAGLDAAHVPALPVQGSFIPPCRQGTEFTFATPDEAPYPLNILCLNGDAIPHFAEEAGADFFAGRHTIALWWWEVGELPASWQEAFRWVDEVWVATDHIRDLIAPSCPVPVTKITLPVGDPRVAPVTRADLGMPEDDFVFLYVYDYHSTEARKNPTGLVRAFKDAFPPGSGAHLLLKCINADSMFAHHDRVLLEVGDRPDITFIDDYLSVGEKNALIALSDCYVSPHRSEGFGLTPAEALLLGTPVIATGYGGVLEFLDAENAYLLDFAMRRVGEHADPYPADAEWADPDLAQLTELLRHVRAHPEEAAARAERGAWAIRAEHSPAAAAESMRAPLQDRYEHLVDEGARSLRLRRVEPMDLEDPARQVRGALRGPVERGGGVRGRASQVRQRLTRPVTAQRDLVDAQLFEQLAELDGRVRELTAELDRHRMASHAEVLAQFRRLRAELGGVLEHSEERDHELAQRADALSREIEQHLAERDARPFLAAPYAPGLHDDPVAGRVLGYDDANGGPPALVDVLGGSEDRVRALRRAYVPLLRDAAPVLDIACGRGELLDLLAEAGVAARGVEAEPELAARARAKGHEVAEGDALATLRETAEGELGALAALEVAQRLSADALSELLDLARSRLRPGGLLVAETVNPQAPAALTGFWADPRHRRPLLPDAMLALARVAGFPSAYVFHPNGSGDVERDRTREPVYALVARA